MLSFDWISLLMLFLFYFFTIKTLKPRTPPLSLHHGKLPLLLPPQHDLPIPWDKVFSPHSSKFKFRDTIFSKFANILQKCQTSVLASSFVGPPLVTKLLCPEFDQTLAFSAVNEGDDHLIYFLWPLNMNPGLAKAEWSEFKKEKMPHFCLFHRTHVYVQ